MQKTTLVILLIIQILFFPGINHGQEIKGLTIDYKPWGYRIDGYETGAFYECLNLILSTFSNETGVNSSHKIVPLARIRKDMIASVADLSILTPSPLTDGMIDLGVIFEGIEMVLLPKKGVVLHSTDDLEGLRIGLPRGADAHVDFLRQPGVDLFEVNKPAQMLYLLKADRIDVALETNLTFATAMGEGDFSKDDYGSPLVVLKGDAFQARLWMSKNSQALEHQQKIMEIVTRFREEKRFDKIFQLWLSFSQT